METVEQVNAKIDSQEEQLRQFEVKQKNIERVIHRRADHLEMAKLHCMPRAQLSFEVEIAEHCNLNCRGCDHFSSLSEPELADLEEMNRDFARIAELFES